MFPNIRNRTKSSGVGCFNVDFFKWSPFVLFFQLVFLTSCEIHVLFYADMISKSATFYGAFFYADMTSKCATFARFFLNADFMLTTCQHKQQCTPPSTITDVERAGPGGHPSHAEVDELPCPRSVPAPSETALP